MTKIFKEYKEKLADAYNKLKLNHGATKIEMCTSYEWYKIISRKWVSK